MTQELEISAPVSRRRKGRPAPDTGRRDGAADIAPPQRERDGLVRAVVRPSRRDRRAGRSRKGGNRHDDFGKEKKTAAAASEMVPERVILRRNPIGGLDLASMPGLMAPEAAAAVAGLGLWDYDIQLRNLQRQREQYLMSRAAAAAAYYPYVTASSPPLPGLENRFFPWGVGAPAVTSRPESPASPGACEECEAAREEGRAAGFHRCIYDAVTVAFRSPAGPIQRPTKKHVEASA